LPTFPKKIFNMLRRKWNKSSTSSYLIRRNWLTIIRLTN
jgi:hypothetical protein